MQIQSKSEIEKQQQQHFDTIADEYEMNYDDEYSAQYREYFIYKPMLDNIQLSGKRVLEAMCGSGQTTEYLLLRGASITGLDISEKLVKSFKKRWPQADVVERSIFETEFKEEYFDVVIIIGGLHHLHPHVNRAIDEVYRVLKKGGYFCFAEPYSASWVNVIRKIWYKHDSLFEKNEGPIDLDMIKIKHSSQFNYIQTKYVGSIAFLLVLNSMIFRIPTLSKKYYANLLMFIEKFFSWFHRKRTACLSLNIWKKI